MPDTTQTAGKLLESYLNNYSKKNQPEHPNILGVGPSLNYWDDTSILYTSNWIKNNKRGKLTVVDKHKDVDPTPSLPEKASEPFSFSGDGDLTTYEQSFNNLLSLVPGSFVFPNLEHHDATELPWKNEFDIIIDHATWHYLVGNPLVDRYIDVPSAKPSDLEERCKNILNSYNEALTEDGIIIFFHDVETFEQSSEGTRGEDLLQKHLKDIEKDEFEIQDKYRLDIRNSDELKQIGTYLQEKKIFSEPQSKTVHFVEGVFDKALVLLPKYSCRKATIVKKF